MSKKTLHSANTHSPRSHAAALNWAKLAIAATLASAPLAIAEEQPAKPVLTELSLTVKEIYDSNVFGSEYNLAGFDEVANVESWVTAVAPKATVNLLSAFGIDGGSVSALDVGYAGVYSFYHSAPDESNQRHNFINSLKYKSGAWSASLDNTLTYVDGDTTTPHFSTSSAYGSASARERREQFQDRGKFEVRYDDELWFARAVGSLLYYDLRTEQHRAVAEYAGWQNYVDRSDANAGFDFGYKAAQTWALTTGYRYGSQFQDKLPSDIRPDGKHSNSHYHRVLVGVEGKILPWLKVDLQAGPDFRSYEDSAYIGINGDSHTWFYSDASLTATLGKNDTLTLSNKIWNFVSSTGVATYRDSTYSLGYKHKFNSALSATAGIRVLGSAYDAPTVRNDWLYTYSLGLQYTVNKHVSLTADYARTQADNRLDEALTPGREFNQDLITLGVRVAL